MATMKDVARHAGVSAATVCRVINNTVYVKPVTRERVETAMREFNYQRNVAAHAMAKRSGKILGLLTGNLDDPFFSRMARGIEDSARKAKVQLVVCSGGHHAEFEKAGLDYLINQGCEAIVAYLPRMNEEDILRYAAHTPALVVLNRYLPVIANRCVWLDNVSAAQAATNQLIQHGHHKIACIAANIPINDRIHRVEGYRKAMDIAGIPVADDWIISVPFNELGGEQAAEKLLQAGLNFTALVTFNDVMAAGIMRTFHHHQVRVPVDISIVGFDDIAWAKYLHPALTTMHNPIEKMARRAATLALQLNAGVVGLPQNNGFCAELIPRASVKQV